jgi:hypothetical protein
VYTKDPFGTPKLRPLLSGGRCSVGTLCFEQGKRDCKIVAAVGMWSLFRGGR